MRRAQWDAELFTVVPGVFAESWTINGEPTEVTSGTGAIAQVFSLATRFPAHLYVRQGEKVRVLVMDKRGRTEDITPSVPMAPEQTSGVHVQEQKPVEEEFIAASIAPVITEAEDITPAGDVKGTAHAEPGPVEDPENAKRSRQHVTPLRVVGVVALGAVLGVGGAIASQGSDDAQIQSAAADTAAQEFIGAETPDGWTLPEGQKVVSILGNRIATVEGTTVRILDADTGEEVWSMDDVDNATDVRSIDGTTASAVDAGAGQVTVLRDGEVSAVSGALNGRGTKPVITSGREYTGPDGTTGSLADTQAVLAATAQGVVLLESPNKVVTGELS